MYRLIFLIILSSLSFEALAIRIEQLEMPGKLIEKHHEYEDSCELCHSDFNPEGQTGLCRDCHREIDLDVSLKKGYHGHESVRNKECVECHTDHKGRDADIVVFEELSFLHKQTDFELKGKHKTLSCNSCHEKDKQYRDAPTDCVNCHIDDEPHKGLLGRDCKSCHNEEQWNELEHEFNHGQTDFPLRFKHADLECTVCHTENMSKALPTQCVTCHVVNDVHGGRYGKRCQDCHTEIGWEKGAFNHDQTKFPLRGSHEDVVCDACHIKPIFEKEMDMECFACHENDDKHLGQNGKQCEACHNTVQWRKSIFDHDATDFPLTGKHQDLECTRCHKKDIYDEKLDTDCVGCHKLDDVHKEDLGTECDNCHNEQGWKKEVVFDHDVTGFPLVGLHATAPCEECHSTHVYSEAKLNCDACHKIDDIHEKRLGKYCNECHNPNGWGIWVFDHDVQTNYKLDGEHKDLDCHACHTEPVENAKDIELLTSCISCHKKDDVHEGSLGIYCERCHITESFKKIRVVR